MARYFKDISLDDFKEKLDKMVTKALKDELNDDEISSLSLEGKIERAFIYNSTNVSAKIDKDLKKVIFDCENVMCDREYNDHLIKDENMDAILGLNVLDNGMPFMGVYAGGDWECPVFFIVYWDGSSFRGYIPEEGNTFNKDTKTAYGSEGESKKMAHVPLIELMDLEPTEEQATIKPDLIIQDIKSRITRKV